ncbi:MAG: hypothetical protein WC969_08975 [Elusimicrobiota bacterium]|jgi:hypothetical protein
MNASKAPRPRAALLSLLVLGAATALAREPLPRVSTAPVVGAQAPAAAPVRRRKKAFDPDTHWRPRHRRKAAVVVDSGPARIPLEPGRWKPEVRDALELRLAREGRLSSRYDPEDPPVAVLMLDGLAGAHSAGDALFRRLVDHAEFRFDDKYWRMIPEPFGGERVRAGYNGFKDRPPAVWPKDEDYAVYRKAFYRARREVCRLWGGRECARWKATLLAGFSERDLRAIVREAIPDALAEPVGSGRAGDFLDDPDPVEFPTGLRRVPELEELARKLAEQGFVVWVMSRSDQWSAERFASLYRVPSERVLGVRNVVMEGKLEAGMIPPLPWGTGTVEALLRIVGKEPDIALLGLDDRELAAKTALPVWFLEEGVLPPKPEALTQTVFKPLRMPQSAGGEEEAEREGLQGEPGTQAAGP